MYTCMHVCIYVYMQMPTEVRGIESPGARVIGSCEEPDMYAGNQTQVLFKSQLCSPILLFLRCSFM